MVKCRRSIKGESLGKLELGVCKCEFLFLGIISYTASGMDEDYTVGDILYGIWSILN